MAFPLQQLSHFIWIWASLLSRRNLSLSTQKRIQPTRSLHRTRYPQQISSITTSMMNFPIRNRPRHLSTTAAFHRCTNQHILRTLCPYGNVQRIPFLRRRWRSGGWRVDRAVDCVHRVKGASANFKAKADSQNEIPTLPEWQRNPEI